MGMQSFSREASLGEESQSKVQKELEEWEIQELLRKRKNADAGRKGWKHEHHQEVRASGALDISFPQSSP